MSNQPEMPLDHQIEYVVTDAVLRACARGIRSVLPRWFTNTCDAHAGEVDRLRACGEDEAAAVFAAHGPMLEDFGEGLGIACQDAHADAEGYEDPQVYPCPALLAVAPDWSLRPIGTPKAKS